MATFLRWFFKAVWWFLTALLFYIGVTEDIPAWIAAHSQLLNAVGGETLVRGIAVLFALLLGLIALGPDRVEKSARWVVVHWPGQSKDVQLKERCRLLSEEIYEFLADRRREDHTFRGWLARTRTNTEEERQRLWEQETEDSHRHSTETMVRYAQKFEAEALALFDAAERRGWVSDEDRWCFEHPTNPLGIHEVAQRLGAIGHRL